MLLMFISLAWKAEFLLNFISIRWDKNPTKAARSVLIGGNMALMGAILEQDVLRLEKKNLFRFNRDIISRLSSVLSLKLSHFSGLCSSLGCGRSLYKFTFLWTKLIFLVVQNAFLWTKYPRTKTWSLETSSSSIYSHWTQFAWIEQQKNWM